MDKKRSLGKAEIGLFILMILSIPLYALALFNGRLSALWYIGDALVMIVWIMVFILPKTLKELKQERKL
jgi:hypothetical protein